MDRQKWWIVEFLCYNLSWASILGFFSTIRSDNIESRKLERGGRSYPFFFSNSFRSINFSKRSKRKVLKRKVKKKRRSVSFDELPLFERQDLFPRRFRSGEKPSIDFSTVLDRALVCRLAQSGLLWSTRIYALTRFTVRWIARENGWGNKTKQNGIRVGQRNAPSHV